MISDTVGISSIHGGEDVNERPWIAGQSYSIADIAGFNMIAGLPLLMSDAVNDAKTPRLMEWLRKLYERPAARKTLELGRTEITRRYHHLARPA